VQPIGLLADNDYSGPIPRAHLLLISAIAARVHLPGFASVELGGTHYLQNRLQWVSRPSKRRPHLNDFIGRGGAI
jgi:hypothetical protein